MYQWSASKKWYVDSLTSFEIKKYCGTSRIGVTEINRKNDMWTETAKELQADETEAEAKIRSMMRPFHRDRYASCSHTRKHDRQCTYKVTARRVREYFLPWKSNFKYYMFCECVCMGVRGCVHVRAPYCIVICGLCGSTIVFDIIP